MVSSGESEREEEAEEVGEKAKYDSESPKTSNEEDAGRSEEVSWSVHSSPREMTVWGE